MTVKVWFTVCGAGTVVPEGAECQTTRAGLNQSG